jgi:cysteine-rich repeat protein
MGMGTGGEGRALARRCAVVTLGVCVAFLASGCMKSKCERTCSDHADPVCGDGRLDIDNGEECDDGNTDDADECTNECVLAECGDGITQETNRESCDDGNDVDDDGCNSECSLPQSGGPSFGCDDGNLDPTDACNSATGQRARCGDGNVWRDHEECDDGNRKDDDECRNDCTVNPCPGCDAGIDDAGSDDDAGA